MASGSIFGNLIAGFIIVATGATLYVHGEPTSQRRRGGEGAGAVRRPYAEVLFAIGLLGASLLAAAMLPVTAAY